MPWNFRDSFITEQNAQKRILPASSFKPKYDPTCMHYEDILPQVSAYNAAVTENKLRPLPSQIASQITLIMGTGVPIPAKESINRQDIVGRTVKIALFDVNRRAFIGNSTAVEANWKPQYEGICFTQ